MKPIPFRMVSLDSKESTNLQNAIRDFLKVSERCDLLDGVFLKSKTLINNADNEITHGLNRTPIGWIVCDYQLTGTTISYIKRTSWDEKTITLFPYNGVGGPNVIISLWVF